MLAMKVLHIPALVLLVLTGTCMAFDLAAAPVNDNAGYGGEEAALVDHRPSADPATEVVLQTTTVIKRDEEDPSTNVYVTTHTTTYTTTKESSTPPPNFQVVHPDAHMHMSVDAPAPAHAGGSLASDSYVRPSHTNMMDASSLDTLASTDGTATRLAQATHEAHERAAAATAAAAAAAAACPWVDVSRRGHNELLTRVVQHLLNAHEHLRGEHDTEAALLTVDGKYGARTAHAMKAFQRLRGLRPDGAASAVTWPHLLMSVNDGSPSDAVRALHLVLFGWRGGGGESGLSGKFGPRTVERVKQIQRAAALPVTGFMDLASWRSRLCAGGELAGDPVGVYVFDNTARREAREARLAERSARRRAAGLEADVGDDEASVPSTPPHEAEPFVLEIKDIAVHHDDE